MTSKPGSWLRAPEFFLPDAFCRKVNAEGFSESRRRWMERGFRTAVAAAAGAATGSAMAQTGSAATSAAPAAAGDPHILEKKPWQTMLGQPVAARPYGVPSTFEENLKRRESPGLTRVAQASVAFTPLQGCSASSRQTVFISNGITRAGSISILSSTA